MSLNYIQVERPSGVSFEAFKEHLSNMLNSAFGRGAQATVKPDRHNGGVVCVGLDGAPTQKQARILGLNKHY